MDENNEIAQREKCPQCGGRSFHVNHLIRPHHHGRVYLECVDCGYFTARLIVHAYVDPDHYRSFLQASLNKSGDSARKLSDNFQIHAARAVEQSEKVKKLLAQKENDDLEEKSIRQLYDEYLVVEDGQN